MFKHSYGNVFVNELNENNPIFDGVPVQDGFPFDQLVLNNP